MDATLAIIFIQNNKIDNAGIQQMCAKDTGEITIQLAGCKYGKPDATGVASMYGVCHQIE